MDWAHQAQDDPEWNDFVAGNAGGGGALLFGRVTYELMASFWPTPMATSQMPEVAEGMNRAPKYVCSRTLARVAWSNTTLLAGELVSAVRALKATPGPNLTILGSGSVVAQLSEARLVDTYQIVLNPIALGAGRSPFDGLTRNLALRHTSTRSFRNGSVLLQYEPRS